MFFRIVLGVSRHFESRITEWAMGGTIMWWGAKLIGPENVWHDSAPWAEMLRWLPENTWGWVCIVLGLLRLIALTVNGTFADTAYSRFSPHVRGITAIAGATVWFMIFVSVSAVPTAGSGIYQLPLVLDLWCVFHAWREVGRARAKRDGLVL